MATVRKGTLTRAPRSNRRTLELMLVMPDSIVREVRVDIPRHWLRGQTEWSDGISILRATVLGKERKAAKRLAKKDAEQCR